MAKPPKVLYYDYHNSELISLEDDDELESGLDGYEVAKYVLEGIGRIESSTVFVSTKARKKVK